MASFPSRFFFLKTQTNSAAVKIAVNYIWNQTKFFGLDSLFLYCGKCGGKLPSAQFSRGATGKHWSLMQWWTTVDWWQARLWCRAGTIQGVRQCLFAKVESALSIPPWDNPLEELLCIPWQDLIDLKNLNATNFCSWWLHPTAWATGVNHTVDRRIESCFHRGQWPQKEEYLNFVEQQKSGHRPI